MAQTTALTSPGLAHVPVQCGGRGVRNGFTFEKREEWHHEAGAFRTAPTTRERTASECSNLPVPFALAGGFRGSRW